MKKFKLCIFSVLICLAIVPLTACGSAKPKTFTSSAGISVTLTDKFVEKSIVSQTLYLESKSSIFTASKDSFASLVTAGFNPSTMTLEDYASLVIRNNTLSTTPTTEDELVTFNYEKNVSGKDFYYKAFVFKGTDAFWLCQFACVKTDKEVCESQFVTWAKTIEVS